MEIEWTLGQKRCSRGWWSGMDLLEIHWSLISNTEGNPKSITENT